MDSVLVRPSADLEDRRRRSPRAVFQDLLFIGPSRIKLGDHAIIDQDQDAIGNLQYFVDVAGDQDDSVFRLPPELLNQSVDVLASADIDPDGWLVKNEKLALGRKPFPKHHLLFVAAAQIFYRLLYPAHFDSHGTHRMPNLLALGAPIKQPSLQ